MPSPMLPAFAYAHEDRAHEGLALVIALERTTRRESRMDGAIKCTLCEMHRSLFLLGGERRNLSIFRLKLPASWRRVSLVLFRLFNYT